VSEEVSGEGRSPARAVFWLGPLAALLGAGVALFHDGENGVRAIFHLERELAAADLRLDRLREERAELLLRAERLRADPLEIEAAARQSLGMVRPGEIVVRLPAESSRGD
jgi:cell division protein FtsB